MIFSLSAKKVLLLPPCSTIQEGVGIKAAIREGYESSPPADPAPVPCELLGPCEEEPELEFAVSAVDFGLNVELKVATKEEEGVRVVGGVLSPCPCPSSLSLFLPAPLNTPPFGSKRSTNTLSR
jgi:hypothetical protein